MLATCRGWSLAGTGSPLCPHNDTVKRAVTVVTEAWGPVSLPHPQEEVEQDLGRGLLA